MSSLQKYPKTRYSHEELTLKTIVQLKELAKLAGVKVPNGPKASIVDILSKSSVSPRASPVRSTLSNYPIRKLKEYLNSIDVDSGDIQDRKKLIAMIPIHYLRILTLYSTGKTAHDIEDMNKKESRSSLLKWLGTIDDFDKLVKEVARRYKPLNN